MAYEKYTKISAGAALVTLAQMQDYLKVDDPGENDLIQSLIDGWTFWAEEYCWSSFNETEWTLTTDYWLPEYYIRKNPVKSITSIQYYDEDNNLQVLPSTEYDLYKSIPAKIEILDMPVLYARPDAITITFLAENLESIEQVKNGIKSLVALQFGQKEDYNMAGPYIGMAKRTFSPLRLNFF